MEYGSAALATAPIWREPGTTAPMRGPSSKSCHPSREPWNLRLIEQQAKRAVFVPLVTPFHTLPPPLSQGLPMIDRRMCIRKGIELGKYGVASGCPGCIAAAAGWRAVAQTKGRCEKNQAVMEKDRLAVH